MSLSPILLLTTAFPLVAVVGVKALEGGRVFGVDRVLVILRSRWVHIFSRAGRGRLVLERAVSVQHVVQEGLVVEVIDVMVIVFAAYVPTPITVALRVASDPAAVLLWNMGKWRFII
jgi:hypothetical protein